MGEGGGKGQGKNIIPHILSSRKEKKYKKCVVVDLMIIEKLACDG